MAESHGLGRQRSPSLCSLKTRIRIVIWAYLIFPEKLEVFILVEKIDPPVRRAGGRPGLSGA
jgi:hypothetical protein